jgi:hypothetical protein
MLEDHRWRSSRGDRAGMKTFFMGLVMAILIAGGTAVGEAAFGNQRGALFLDAGGAALELSAAGRAGSCRSLWPTGSAADEGANDQSEDAGECRAGDPLCDYDLAFQGFDLAAGGNQLGIDVVAPALVVGRHRPGRSLPLLRAPAARNAS